MFRNRVYVTDHHFFNEIFSIMTLFIFNHQYKKNLLSCTVYTLSVSRRLYNTCSAHSDNSNSAYSKYQGVSMTLNTGWSSSRNSGGHRLLALQAQLVTAHGECNSRVVVCV